MLLKLKKEQSIKLKITIILIWIAVISMLLNTIYDTYLVYINEFNTFPAYTVYIFYIVSMLGAVGLLFKSKIARGFVLLFSYVPLFIKIMSLLIYSTTRGETIDMFMLDIFYLLLTIYLLSHDEILKVYKVKYLKKEIVVYFVLSMIIFLF